MRYTHLGRTGLSVSRLCLGTMNFTWTTERNDAFGKHLTSETWELDLSTPR